MTMFRKKPVIIEAQQVPEIRPGDSITRYVDQCITLAERCGGRSHMMHSEGDGPDYPGDPGTDHILIPTLEGDMRASPGDWIIKGVNGEFYPCKPDIFEKTYEPVDPIKPETIAGDYYVAGQAEYSSYVDRVFQHLEHELIAGGYDLGDISTDLDANPELYRMYALLAMTTGVATTSEHVHDAWSMWRYVGFPDHRSIIPFDQLTPEVQAHDDAFRDAIRKVAADLPRLRP